MALEIITLKVGVISTNCYVAYCTDTQSAVVIDPGDNPELILKTLHDKGLTLEYVFLTHGHYDHILALPYLRVKTQAKVAIHRLDSEYLTDTSLLGMRTAAGGPIAPADILLRGGEQFVVGSLRFEYIHTPGHTPGSSVISCGDTLFTGDTLFHGDCGRCDLPGGSYSDMLISLKKLYDLPDDYKILPGHDSATTLEEERKNNANMLEAAGK